jgi:crotonobetainyl-CoA:carnitine CoA-transferase CaiB-like acyl-CoA transferase
MSSALSGVRVVDLTTVLMGPFATQLLGDYGADVIKVETPDGDPVRAIGPGRSPQMGAIFLHANRNKRSVVLDLKASKGREAFLRLVSTADVLAYNVRPQAMERLGLGYDAVRTVSPSVIYAGMFGFARSGPYAAKAAYDDLIQGVAGIPPLMQVSGCERPRYVPLAIADRVTALAAVNAVLAALIHRMKTGEGQSIDVTMFETVTRLVLADHLQGHTFIPSAGPSIYPRLVSPDRRPLQTRDGWICLVVYNDKQWRSFFRAIGQEAAFDADPRLSNISERTKRIDELYDFVARTIETRTTEEWLSILDAADVPAMPMLSVDELVDDPHLVATGFFQKIDHSSEGSLRLLSDGTQWSRTPPTMRLQPPRLGEHSADVLASIGYSPREVADLASEGVTRIQGIEK